MLAPTSAHNVAPHATASKAEARIQRRLVTFPRAPLRPTRRGPSRRRSTQRPRACTPAPSRPRRRRASSTRGPGRVSAPTPRPWRPGQHVTALGRAGQRRQRVGSGRGRGVAPRDAAVAGRLEQRGRARGRAGAGGLDGLAVQRVDAGEPGDAITGGDAQVLGRAPRVTGVGRGDEARRPGDAGRVDEDAGPRVKAADRRHRLAEDGHNDRGEGVTLASIARPDRPSMRSPR